MSAEKWTVVCDGGPNNRVIGKTVSGRKQALGIAKTMIDNLSPNRIVITRGDEYQEVLTETEALEGADGSPPPVWGRHSPRDPRSPW